GWLPRRGGESGGGRKCAGQHRAHRRSDETGAEETPKGPGGVAHTNLAREMTGDYWGCRHSLPPVDPAVGRFVVVRGPARFRPKELVRPSCKASRLSAHGLCGPVRTGRIVSDRAAFDRMVFFGPGPRCARPPPVRPRVRSSGSWGQPAGGRR